MLRRMRRLRENENIRNLVCETYFSLDDLIFPIFIEEELSESVEISALPGLYRLSETALISEIEELYKLGIRAVMPFGISHHKDAVGSDTWSENGLISRVTRAIKKLHSDMIVIPDICFCEYTDHGHCGVLTNDGKVDNDETNKNLVKQCVAAARAGADMLAPSSMMDGQVKAIRKGLDAEGFENVSLLAHSIKFASSFYGPFRTAVECELHGDRKSYQMDYRNGRQALVEASLDEEEGADILMVKPGTPYLDVLSKLRQQTNLPLAVYQVGGEYAGIKYSALAGAIDEQRVVMETIYGFKRAGADLIVSYYAKQIAQWMQQS